MVAPAAAQQAHLTHAQAVAHACAFVAKVTLDEKITELHGIGSATLFRPGPGHSASWHTRAANDQRPGRGGPRGSGSAEVGHCIAGPHLAGRHLGPESGWRVRPG